MCPLFTKPQKQQHAEPTIIFKNRYNRFVGIDPGVVSLITATCTSSLDDIQYQPKRFIFLEKNINIWQNLRNNNNGMKDLK